MNIRSVYGDRKRVALDFRVADPKSGEFVVRPGRTVQAEKDSCDINKILERYTRTGQLPDMIRREPRYGDFSEVPTFQEALEVVQRAETQFAGLSARVRERFHNEPAEMLAFCSDPKNAEEMIKLGLALPAKPVELSPSQPTEPKGEEKGSSNDPAVKG